MSFITSLNGVPTPHLDAFVEATRALKEGEYVRISTVSAQSRRPKVVALRLDTHYWKGYQLTRGPGGEWARTEL